MNCEKHLNKKVTNTILLTGLLVFSGCSEETKKTDYIARVNETYLTREEFASLADTSNLNSKQKDQLIKNWIYNEMLFQAAKDRGVTNRDDYKNYLEKSSKELAGAMLIEEFAESEEINYTDEDLINYFDKNKNYFRLNINSYLINKVSFDNEDKAIKFRALALESDWENSVNIFSSDSSLLRNKSAGLIEENNVYPLQLSRIIKDLYPEEISIVITEKPGYYSVVQKITNFEKDSVPPFEIIKSKVAQRFIAEMKRKLIENYLKELYSENEIEIKK
jgi:hypothetical protein